MSLKVDDPRDIQSAYEDNFTPDALHATETQPDGSHESIPGYDRAGDGLDAREKEFDASKELDDAESGTSGSWINSTTLGGGAEGKTNLAKNLKNIALKKSGPTAVIATILATASISLSLLFSPSMLLIHMKEVIVDRFNIQNTAIDIRSNKILAKKLTSTMTSSCKVSITCKFNKMSNASLKRMADEGLVPYDKHGNKIDVKDGKWGSQRPAEFRPSEELRLKGEIKFPSTANGVESVNAKSLSSFLRENPAAAGVYRRAFNPRWTAFWDTTFSKFLTRMGFGSKSSKIQGKDEKAIKESIAEEIDAAEKDSPTKATTDPKEADKNATQEEKDAINKENASKSVAAGEANDLVGEAKKSSLKELSSKIGDKIKGGAMLVVNLYCLAVDEGPKIAKALRAIQLAQLVAFGLLFLQVADEIKAGHGDATKVAEVASLFSIASINATTGKTLKKSAMESDGMLYALAGNSKFNSSTSSASRWIPGGGFIQILYKLSNMLSGNNGAVKSVAGTLCGALNSFWGGLAQLAINITPAGAVLALATELVTRSPLFNELMSTLFQNLAGKIVDSAVANEDLGNAAGIGMVLGLGEGGNAGGMMPMTVADAVAYSKATQESRLANARIDRATISPFDASNPNTFLGSITSQLIPYYGMAAAGPIGTLGAFSRVVGSTFGSLISPRAFAESNLTEEELKMCPDAGIVADGIAAGPVCDVQYGIPINYLQGIDPADNVAWLVSKGQVEDDEAGTIKQGSKLEEYLTNCQGGEEASTKQCIIDSEEKARYALYSVDHRIQQNMDGEETYGGAGAGTNANTPAASTGSYIGIGDDFPAPHGSQWFKYEAGQCTSFAFWRLVQGRYGSALAKNGSNLQQLIDADPAFAARRAFGNGNVMASSIINQNFGVRITDPRTVQAGDIVSTGTSKNHVFVVAKNNGDGTIVIDSYNDPGGSLSYKQLTVKLPGSGAYYFGVIARPCVKDGPCGS